MAFKENSFPIEGRAILIADVMNGVRKEARVAINKAEFFSAESSILRSLNL